MKAPDPTLLDLLYRALHAEYGIVVTTNSIDRLRQKLYAVRRESGDEDLSLLSLVVSPTNPETELFILRRPNDRPTETHPEPEGG
jgi:hypothetical protein